MADPRTVATYTTYLFQGFDGAHKTLKASGYAYVDDIYEQHAGMHSGEVGIVMDLFYHAEEVAKYIEELEKADPNLWDSSPGVMEYEVINELGGWLFSHPEHFNENPKDMDAWRFFMKPSIADWFYPPAAPAAQPESESTMKISDLIVKLEDIRSEEGDLDVLTRGSEPQKMVDASDVRTVTTPKRTAVFIGKPKAD